MKDEEIIALYFARDDTAIVETAAKYGGYLISIAQRILHSTDDSEEVVNDTYHGAWRTIPPKRPDVLRLFLARIARNIAIDRLEYKLAQKRNADKDVLLSEVTEFLPAETDVEETLEARELGEMINTFLGTLDARNRIIFVKRYFYAHSVREIASQLGLTESLVKNALFRTRNKLRTYLEKEGVAI